MREVHGVSIWLSPDQASDSLCRRMCAALRRRLPGPSFDPHVTLAGEITRPPAEVMTFCREAYSDFLPQGITFTGLRFDDDFYRAVILEARTNPRLAAARRIVCERFTGRVLPYEPHLSLAYGEFVLDDRHAAVKELGITFPLQMRFEKLSIVETEGQAENWKTLAVFG